MGMKLGDVSLADVGRDDFRVGAKAGSEDGMVVEHVERLVPDAQPVVQGALAVVGIELVRQADRHPRDARHQKGAERRSAEEQQLGARLRHGDHRDQGQDRERQQAGARKREDHRGEEEDEAGQRREAIFFGVGVERESGGERDGRLEKHRGRVGVLVESLRGVGGDDGLVAGQHVGPHPEVEDGEEGRAGPAG